MQSRDELSAFLFAANTRESLLDFNFKQIDDSSNLRGAPSASDLKELISLDDSLLKELRWDFDDDSLSVSLAPRESQPVQLAPSSPLLLEHEELSLDSPSNKTFESISASASASTPVPPTLQAHISGDDTDNIIEGSKVRRSTRKRTYTGRGWPSTPIDVHSAAKARRASARQLSISKRK